MSTTATWTQDRIDAIQLQIEAYEAAVLAFAANGAQMKYKLDTGQQVITVERADPTVLQRLLSSLYNQHSVLCNRLSGSPGHNARGDF